jgi:hypothetical protein
MRVKPPSRRRECDTGLVWRMSCQTIPDAPQKVYPCRCHVRNRTAAVSKTRRRCPPKLTSAQPHPHFSAFELRISFGARISVFRLIPHSALRIPYGPEYVHPPNP